MIAILVFIGMSALLFVEGRLLSGAILGKRDTNVSLALAYPLGVALNAMLFTVLQIAGIGFTTLTVMVLHALLCVALVLLWKRTVALPPQMRPAIPEASRAAKAFLIVALIGVIVVLLNGAAHAFILPSSYWDTFTNWNMRAARGLAAGTFLFDGAEKAHYPILLHALQALYGLLHGWKEWMANGATFLLSLTTVGGVFVLARERHGGIAAGGLVVALLGLPLAAVHLMQGYGDIHVAEFALLSAMLLDAFRRDARAPLFLLSALFATAAAMTKLDGVYFVAVPWVLLGAATILGLPRASGKRYLPWLALPIVVSAAWFLYVTVLGLNVTPHGSTGFTWHPDHIITLLRLCLTTGSMGLHWFLLPTATVWLLWVHRGRVRALPVSLLWGLLSVVLVAGVYVFTEQVTGEFDILRALLPSTLLWTLGAVMGYFPGNLPSRGSDISDAKILEIPHSQAAKTSVG